MDDKSTLINTDTKHDEEEHHEYAEINPIIENIMMVLIFISIIVLANIYQELKTVKIKKLNF